MTVFTDDEYLAMLDAKRNALDRAQVAHDGTAAGLQRAIDRLTTDKLAAELETRQRAARESQT